MFKRLKFIKKRCLNNLRCYAASPFNQDFENQYVEDGALNYYTQDHSLIRNNIDTNQLSKRFDENPLEQTNLIKEVEHERPLDQALNSLESKYNLKDIVDQNQPAFINNLIENSWNYKFYNSKYIVSDAGTKKLVVKGTETRNPTEISKLCYDAFDNSKKLALGVNLSSITGYQTSSADLVMIDIDPPSI